MQCLISLASRGGRVQCLLSLASRGVRVQFLISLARWGVRVQCLISLASRGTRVQCLISLARRGVRVRACLVSVFLADGELVLIFVFGFPWTGFILVLLCWAACLSVPCVSHLAERLLCWVLSLVFRRLCSSLQLGGLLVTTQLPSLSFKDSTVPPPLTRVSLVRSAGGSLVQRLLGWTSSL